MANNGAFATGDYNGRYIKFSWSVSSQSIENNTTTIYWKIVGEGVMTNGHSYVKAGNFRVEIDGNVVYQTGQNDRFNLYQGTLVKDGYYTMTHNTAGARNFSANVGCALYTYAQNCFGNGNWDLPQIARYSQMQSATNFNDEQNPTITFTNPSNGLFPLKAKIEANNDVNFITRNISNTATSYTFELTESERNRLRQLCPNSNTLVVRFAIACLNSSGTEVNSSYVDRTMTIVNANPTMGNPTYQDIDSTTLAITQDSQRIIQNKSDLQFTIQQATALKYATISKYQITINGVTQETTTSGNYDWGLLNVANNVDATIKAIDSRGNSITKTLTILIDAWQLPSAIINLNRQNNFYSETLLEVNPTFSSLNNQNTLTIQYQYKKTTDTNYSNPVSINARVQTTIILDNLYEWNLKVILTDRLGTTTYNLLVPKGMPILYIDRLKNSMGMNCFPQEEQSLEINGKTLFDMVYPVGSIYMSMNATNPSTIFGGTWTQIKGRFLLGVGSPDNNNNNVFGTNLTWNGSEKFNEAVGTTGGESLHTLNTNEMPSHRHNTQVRVNWYNDSSNGLLYNGWGQSSLGVDRETTYTDYQGGGSSHNNMPPFMAVYMWQRTA